VRIILVWLMSTTQIFSVAILPTLICHYLAFIYLFCFRVCWGCCCSWGVDQDIKMLQRRQDVTLFLWWWKPLLCGHPLLCICCRQLPIAPQLIVGLARKHFLQQLSVSLWINNARMILRYWALQGEDSDFLTLQ